MPSSASPQPGRTYPLGATWDGSGVNFALFSANATAVRLCLFDGPDADIEARFVDLTPHESQIWSVYLPGVKPGQLYGYRVDGPHEPFEGLRFNSNKLLFDPYARAIGRPLRWHDSVFGYPARDGRPVEQSDTALRDERDSGPYAPLGAVVDPGFDWGADAPPRTPWEETVLYELHVKGFTRLHPGVPEPLRGTYAGLASDAAIEHIVGLGVTAVELLPVHAFIDEPRLGRLGLSNYWGYNSLGFFAPHPAYAADKSPSGTVAEFKSMVKALHAAGLEVILDVVYNHTCEGNERGPTICWRGIDNTSYYRLRKNKAQHVNFTGVGNTTDTRHPRTLQMVLDSLRYWVEEMHVDGFRFDLCTALGRESDDFDRGSGFFDAILQDPVLTNVKMIAEPWDIGPDGYQVGGYPIGWREWNGKYRDDMRQFWRGDDARIGYFATRLAGSSDRFDWGGRRPTASINLITAHDGYTLHDLVSYERKHNLANGEHNRDGDSHNNSRNYGVEGPTSDAKITAVRERQKRNLLASLILSQGTPMILAGDEIGRTQQGNNNAYCQDNEISWLDWNLDDRQRGLLEFTRRLLKLRLEHPELRATEFFTGETIPGTEFRDIVWLEESGHEMKPEHWRDAGRRWIGACLGPRYGGDTLLLLVNAEPREIEFSLPPAKMGGHWELLFDTAAPEEGVANSVYDVHYPLQGRSFVALRMTADLG